MAGILDTKTRIFDTLITEEGRRQLASGELQIKFVSFTDGHTFYQGDTVSGSDDASRRLFLEATSRRQDQITFETDDEGKLVPFNGNSLVMRDGQIISSSVIIPPGDRFASLSADLLASSIDNYRNLYLLGTDDPFRDAEGFSMSVNTASFIISPTTPLNVSEEVTSISIDDVESFFQDKRLGHIPNFQHLPPVILETTRSLGRFPCEGQAVPLSYAQIERHLGGLEFEAVTFYDTSRQGNLVSQIFELAGGRLQKLDIIDFGEFTTSDAERPTKQVYFAGKVFEDSNGMNTFVNIFTIVFD